MAVGSEADMNLEVLDWTPKLMNASSGAEPDKIFETIEDPNVEAYERVEDLDQTTALRVFCREILNVLESDVAEYFGDGERTKIEKVVEAALLWQSDNPDAEDQQIELVRQAIEDFVNPLVTKAFDMQDLGEDKKKGKKKKRKKKKYMQPKPQATTNEGMDNQDAHADQQLTKFGGMKTQSTTKEGVDIEEERADQLEQRLGKLKLKCDRVWAMIGAFEAYDDRLEQCVDDTLDWLDTKPRPKPQELKAKQKEFEDFVIPIMKKLGFLGIDETLSDISDELDSELRYDSEDGHDEGET